MIKQVIQILKRFFCLHKYNAIESNRYQVNKADGTKEGEVRITLYQCELCRKEKLMSSERTHIKKTE